MGKTIRAKSTGDLYDDMVTEPAAVLAKLVNYDAFRTYMVDHIGMDADDVDSFIRSQRDFIYAECREQLRPLYEAAIQQQKKDEQDRREQKKRQRQEALARLAKLDPDLAATLAED